MKKKFKDYLNFSFYDANNDLEVRNYKIFDASLRAFLLYLLIMLPIFAFSYVLFSNENLIFYARYKTETGAHLWQLMDISNGLTILAFWAVGLFFFLFSIIGFLFFKPIVTGKRFPKNQRYVYIIVLAVIALLAILFFGLSQFEYSRFFEYYRYSLLFDNYEEIKFDWAIPVTKYFMEHHKSGSYNYGWSSTPMSLWMMFWQMLISFISFLVLQNAVFTRYNQNDLKEENYIFLNSQKNIGETGVVINNRFLRGLKNFFKNDQRNLTVYMLIGAILVLFSNFVYSILITSSGTNLGAMVDWSYRISYLFADLKGFVNEQGFDGYQQIFETTVAGKYYGTLFTISSLQIISIGLTISVLFFFVVVIIREKRVSYNIFTVQTALLFSLLIITVTTMLISKVFVYELEAVWNKNDNNEKFLGIIKQAVGNSDENIERLFNTFYPHDIFNPNGFKVEWLSYSSNIADAIITYSFIIALFIIVTVNNNYLKRVAKKIISDINKLKRNKNQKQGGSKNDRIKSKRSSRNR